MAPELLFDSKKESDYSNAVDIWSLGCLLYYLLTKKLAFQGLRELDQYYKSIASFPDSQLIEHGVGSSGRCFVESLMSPVPDDRPAASKDLLAKWDMHVEGAPEGQHHPVEQSFPVTAGAEFARAIDALPVANTRWDGAPSISEVPMVSTSCTHSCTSPTALTAIRTMLPPSSLPSPRPRKKTLGV
ncbi:kinase-like domain-containing protein [Aspergillus falconensis]